MDILSKANMKYNNSILILLFILFQTNVTAVKWTCAVSNASFVPRAYHSSVVFNEKLLIFNGNTTNNGIQHNAWSSSDGITWTQIIEIAQFPIRTSFPCLVFNKKLWVIGGFNGL